MRILLSSLIIALACPALLTAADHRVEKLTSPPSSGSLAAPIEAKLSNIGVRVIRGSSREVCSIWLCKEWPVKAFDAAGDLLYPFTPGQLIGVVHYPRKGSDFRDQDIAEGMYTLRYAQQPVDGAHVGTSLTRDFLVLIRAEDDPSAEPMSYKQLAELSAKAAGTTHPCLLSLQRPEGEEAIRHQEQRDWWIVRLTGKAVKDDQSQPLPLDLVVVGQAE
jgi:hypothetical protein